MTGFISLKKKRLRKSIKKPVGDRVFNGLNIFFLILFCLLVIIPLLNLIAFAFSSGIEEKMIAEVKAHPDGVFWDFLRLIPVKTDDDFSDDDDDDDDDDE